MSQKKWDKGSVLIGLVVVFVLGLIIGVMLPAPEPSVGEPVPEKTQLFDRPLKKGVENLIWQS